MRLRIWLGLAKVVAAAMLVVRNGFIIRLVLLAVILLAWFLRNIPPCTMLRLVNIGIFDNLHQKNAPAYYGIKAGRSGRYGDVSYIKMDFIIGLVVKIAELSKPPG